MSNRCLYCDQEHAHDFICNQMFFAHAKGLGQFNAVAPQELQPSGQGRGVGEHPATTPAPAAASPHESAGGKPEEPKQYKFSPYTDTMVAGIGYISIKDYEILRAHAEQLQETAETQRQSKVAAQEQAAMLSNKLEQAEAKLREVHELDRQKLHNAFTEVIARGLHYLENCDKIVGLQSAQEVTESIDGGIKRYMSDVAYRAKVQRIVAHLMIALTAQQESITLERDRLDYALTEIRALRVALAAQQGRDDFEPMLYEVAQNLAEALCGFLNDEKPFDEGGAAVKAFHKWEDENLTPFSAELAQPTEQNAAATQASEGKPERVSQVEMRSTSRSAPAAAPSRPDLPSGCACKIDDEDQVVRWCGVHAALRYEAREQLALAKKNADNWMRQYGELIGEREQLRIDLEIALACQQNEAVSIWNRRSALAAQGEKEKA